MNSRLQLDGAVTVQWFLEQRAATSSRSRAALATRSPLPSRVASFLRRFSHWLDHSQVGMTLGLIALGSLLFSVLSWGN